MVPVRVIIEIVRLLYITFSSRTKQKVSKEEYDKKQKELEGVANPIMANMCQATGEAPGGFPGAALGGFTGSDNSEPTVEELD
ncbi:Hsp70 chaperone [Basidiobolus ranarum]|uniref:Hsp70 chaperone n=1 Tax=Basidiobolus ranarum TaxID=34480 RepID=A0ABR2VLU8_9FUNG